MDKSLYSYQLIHMLNFFVLSSVMIAGNQETKSVAKSTAEAADIAF